MPLNKEDEIHQAAIKTAEYLYGVDDYEHGPELLEAIGRLRQLINEEFVGKNKSVSSQLIYDILKEPITSYANAKFQKAMPEKLTVEKPRKPIRYIGGPVLHESDEGFNEALHTIQKNWEAQDNPNIDKK